MTTTSRPIGRRAALARAGQVIVSYAVASVVETVAFSEIRGGGHPDAPLTMFPEYLVLAPVMPFLLVADFLRTYWWLDVVSTGVFVGCFVGTWILYSRLHTRLSTRTRMKG